MAMRISGIASGLDTDSMVQELVKVSSTKKETLEKEQTKLGWKQEAWKELNTKVHNFFQKQLDTLKYESAYKKKKTTVADEKLASVITGDNAVNGTQTLAVKQLAKSGYLTGGKLSDDGSVTEDTTLAQLCGLGDGDKASIHVKNGSRETVVELTGKTTIKELVRSLKGVGLNASFDAENQRIFVAASQSGFKNDFTFNAGNENGLKALSGLGLMSESDLSNPDSRTYQNYKYWADAWEDDGAGGWTLNEDIFQKKVRESAAEQAAELIKDLQGYEDEVEALRKARTKLTSVEDKSDNLLKSDKAQRTLADAANVLKTYYQSVLDSDAASEEEKKVAQEGLERAKDAYDVAASAADSMGIELPQVAPYNLMQQVESRGREYAKTSLSVVNGGVSLAGTNSESAVRIQGQNGLISLNGADFESDTNTFAVNGLTVTANNTSAVIGTDASGKPIYEETTITTADDVDGIYDMIKNFFKEYNDLIKEMDTYYNADSAKGYEPLTDEEKDAMSETEVEKWEKKIKDSLLRRDSSLGTLTNTFKTTMLSSYKINGKNYSLSSFGINTLGYFLSGENEKGVFHIDGDPDDSNTSGNTDVLKTMIANDPDTVVSFFSSLIGDLQGKVNKLMQHTDYRSVYHVYDDKLMQTQYDSYTTKIKEQEKKLEALEDRYYNQFAQMESALSKLNSQQSYISSMFGG